MARFAVTYTVHGTATDIVEAESLEAAKALIEEQLEDEDFIPDLDEADDVDFDVREMHPATRDGHQVWTTYVLPSDTRGHA